MEWVDQDIAVARLTLSPPLPPAAPPLDPLAATPPSPTMPCDDMNAPPCGLAARCVLELLAPQSDPRYRCRDAAGACEGARARPVVQLRLRRRRRPRGGRSGSRAFTPKGP
ncbi:MAG: hypothetical protein JWM10_1895 [Myxococcaceae bacterium]|nr:hypothetical protein [Myxococcaceae bacterium]